MTARVEAERAIAGVLAGHGLTEGFVGTEGDCLYRNYICTCGWWSTADQEGTYRAHVASVLADLMADAWDEGYRASAGDHWWTFEPEDECQEPHRPNPYREDDQ